jgi:3D (Asp-Asp-Asp) domain-containing protein
MSKRQILIVILIVTVSFCAGTFATGNYAINQINLLSEELNKELVLRHEIENKLGITTAELQIETEKATKLNNDITTIKDELEKAQATISNLKSDEYKFVYVGDYKITHYCTEKFEHMCGTGSGLTATSTNVIAGRTVAVDPRVIPYGTEMYIEGYGFRVAEDCGGAVNGNHIDVAVDGHERALAMGTTTGGVWLLVKKGY